MRNNMSTKESRRFDSAPSHDREAASILGFINRLEKSVEPNVESQPFSGGVESRHAGSMDEHAGDKLPGVVRATHSVNESTMNSGSSAPPAQIPFATEAGHWYLQTGEPYYVVPNKSKPGTTRPVTITDAKKVGAVPSVTGIIGLIKGEGLIQYIRKQVFEATLKCPFALKDETPEAHMARALAMAAKHAKDAAYRGTSLHTDIERYLDFGTLEQVSDRWRPHVTDLVHVLKLNGVDLRAGQRDGVSEKSFAHPLGFGGKCDYHQFDEPLVLDFKSKPSITPGVEYAYDEHAMQIASYAVGLGLSLRTVRGINVFIGEQDQRILVHEWPTPDLESAWEQFRLLLRIWQIRKKYCPAFGGEEKEE